MSTYTPTCDLYDRIYSFKDYASETAAVVRLVETEHPSAKTLLDVACGTGSHHPFWAERFEVSGLDLEPGFVALAKRKNPGGTYHAKDMVTFELGRTFDVVTCLFSSIGYVRTAGRLDTALARMGRHLNDDGVLLLEPWITPENWGMGGRVSVDTGESDGLKVVRMMHTSREGDVSVLRGEYLVGSPSTGIERRSDRHELGLFSRAQMMAAFETAGLDPRYEEPGLTGRGLYLARKKGA